MSSTFARAWLALASGLSLCACSQVPVAAPDVAECGAPTGLARTGPALVGQPYGTTMKPIPLNAVQFASTGLSHSMAVQGLYAARTPADTVRIQARFVSCMDEPVAVHMRTSFLRADTAPAEPSSAWKVVFLPARTTVLYEESSVSRDAATYLIEVGP